MRPLPVALLREALRESQTAKMLRKKLPALASKADCTTRSKVYISTPTLN